MVFWKEYAPSNNIAQRILVEIEKDPSNENLLTISQINFLLHVLAIKGDLTPIECKIRKYLIGCLASKGNMTKVIHLDI